MSTNEQMNNAIPTDLPGGIDGTGVYHTPQAAIDAVIANLPFGGCKVPPGADGVEIEPSATPISPDAPVMARGEERHMSLSEATEILMRLAVKRDRTEDEVTALQMGSQRMIAKHFQKQRNLARRRAARAAVADVPPVADVASAPVEAQA